MDLGTVITREKSLSRSHINSFALLISLCHFAAFCYTTIILLALLTASLVAQFNGVQWE